MNLYTEEQVKEMIDDAHNGVDGYYDIFKKHTPIELPSDEEIENRIKTHNPYPKQKQMHVDWANGFERGAKWMKEQIKGDNK